MACVKEFYHKSSVKPKIFGMTASPVVRKGNPYPFFKEKIII